MLPRTLKNFNIFTNGLNWAGVAQSIQIPKISRKMEDFRGAGMIGDVALAMGYEKLEGEITYAGFDSNHYKQMGTNSISGLPVRYVGVYERQDTGDMQHVEIYLRGRAKELDSGEVKNGEKTEVKMSFAYTYFRIEVEGEVLVELDLVNGTEIFGDSDLAESTKELLGL